MNRKERRAAQKRAPVGVRVPSADASYAERIHAEAVRLLQNNQIEAAEFLCRDALTANPSHAGCLHLLGAIALRAGRAEAAAELIRKAIASNKSVARYHDDLGFALYAIGRTEDAIRSHRRAVELDPGNTQTHINLAAKLLALGRRNEAAPHFIKAMELTPEAFGETYAQIKSTLFRINPALEAATARAAEAWPRRLTIEELFGAEGFGTIADDQVLAFVLTAAPARDLNLEALLISIRCALLEQAIRPAQDETGRRLVELTCALARQCFLNEYIFGATPEEKHDAEQIKATIESAVAAKSEVSALSLAAAASYFPIDTISGSAQLLDRTWSPAVDALLAQQLREPAEERKIASTIPNLTPIKDSTSLQVRQQYEENPYPRWVLEPYPKLVPRPVEAYLAGLFPLSPLRRRSDASSDILIAGCGTGRHPMMVAKMFSGANVLAIDLSLASLSYASRQMRKFGIGNISFAQADILSLGSIGRSFDVIESVGVLHHMADPVAGLRVLVSLLRPNGFMRLGLYSEIARHDVVAAREYCARQGYGTAEAEIWAARQALIESDHIKVARAADFFCTSECRDLLFHVQERRFTIAQIKDCLAACNLDFVGFELPQAVVASYRGRFPDDPSLRRLENWAVFEAEQPDTFAAMYQFWVQKN